MSTGAPDHAPLRWQRRPLIAHTALAALLVVVIQIVRGPVGAFVYDGVQYWGGPLALVTGGDVGDVAVLNIRGVLTPLVYLVPAAVSTLLGPASAGWLVLLWNALAAAVVCVIVIPRLSQLVSPGRPSVRIWVAAVLGGVLVSGFAAPPLLDIWSFALAATSLLVLASSRRRWPALLAGVAAAAAVDLRPSYLLPLLLGVTVLTIGRWRQAPWTALVALLGALPQLLYNLATGGLLGARPGRHLIPRRRSVCAGRLHGAVRHDPGVRPPPAAVVLRSGVCLDARLGRSTDEPLRRGRLTLGPPARTDLVRA